VISATAPHNDHPSFAQLQSRRASTLEHTALERTDVLTTLHACDTAHGRCSRERRGRGASAFSWSRPAVTRSAPQLQPPPVWPERCVTASCGNARRSSHSGRFARRACWSGLATNTRGIRVVVSTEHSAREPDDCRDETGASRVRHDHEVRAPSAS
jgi:hypothetical protein